MREEITYSNCCSLLFQSRPRQLWIVSMVLQVMLLFPVLSNVAVCSWHVERVWENLNLGLRQQFFTLDSLLFMIPTWSNNPTVYLPRFSLLWAPDKPLNPITEALIFHLPSFTSIQCALILWNGIFVLSADHPSMVTETFPGAAWVVSGGECVLQINDEY